MYSEWVSLTEATQAEPPPENVLQTFPVSVGREVVQSILKPLVELNHLSSVQSELGSSLTAPEQVQWTMQVIGYGLTLPLTEQTLIQQCIEVYDDWLSAVYVPRKSVPLPVIKEPDDYVKTIFEQFCHVFVPRTKLREVVYLDAHVFLCRRVLQITHNIVKRPNTKLSREAWTALFRYLLKVTDILLVPPIDPSFYSLGSILSEKLVHVLFEAWLHSCVSCFPTPNLWKSLREQCCTWCHHHSVVEQWNKLMYCLTVHVIAHLYSSQYLSQFITLPEEDTDFKQIVADMPNDALVQCWFRMLHTLGNPVEISYPDKIASSPAFQKAAAEYEERKVKPAATYLNELPKIFLEAMKGVATLVYLFLGYELPREEKTSSESSVPSTPIPGSRSSPLARRRDSKESRAPGSGNVGTGVSTPKPRTNTKWYIPGQVPLSPGVASLHPPPSPDTRSPSSHTSIQGLTSTGEIGKPRAKSAESKRSSRTSTSALLSGVTDPTPLVSQDPVNALEYEAGRAEAFGALCTLFSSQPCGEPFLPVYLARFYHALGIGLQYDEELNQGQMLTRIILSSASLLRKDLQGINIMVPKFLSALELILPRKDIPFKCAVDVRDLRHASIHLLLSMLALPLHFLYQPLPDLSALTTSHPRRHLFSENAWESSTSFSSATFLSLRDHLLRLLFDAIEHETDPTNMQMLLNGLLTLIQDIVTYENAVAKMAAAEVGEDAEVSSILRDHPPLVATRSDASSHSLYSQYTSTDFTLPSLFKLCNRAAHHCLQSWEGSVQVSLATLELMGGLARLQIEYIDHMDCRKAVRWVCEYIEHQARKEHPQHSRDLHTSIVAAFKTLLTWVMLHPYLLGNKVCLTAVLRVIELGISGSFSMMDDDSTIYKGDKVPKPISGRVKEIAEFVMACVMEKIGSFPSPCGAEASSSLLSEEDLLARLPQGRKEECHFRYFVLDNSIILGLLEKPFAEDTDALPTVTAIVRSPAGRHVWSLQLRHHPRSEQPSTQHFCSMPRPTPDTRSPSLPTVERKPWPNQVDMEPRMRVDKSIPSLHDILDDNTREMHNKIAALTKRQMEVEKLVHDDPADSPIQSPYPDPSIAMEPPEVKRSFETARLILSHLGLLGIESIKDHPPARYPALAMLDSSSPNFRASLSSLDRLPTRFCDTVFVLYCREGMSKPEEILACQHSLSNKPAEFIEFLHGLGWIVNPVDHPGFAGKIRPSKSEDTNRPVGTSAQVPLRPFPYFADAMTEVAFIVPTLKPSSSDSSTSLRSAESSDSGQDVSSFVSSTSAQVQGGGGEGVSPHSSLPTHYSMQALREPQGSGVSESSIQAGESEKYTTFPMRGKLGSRTEVMSTETPRRRLPIPQDCAVMVVWLEKFEDHVNFPLETMSSILHGGSFMAFGGSHKCTLKRSLPVVFIHMLSSGLYQIATRAALSSRQDSLAGPLIDGMVVSRRTLSVLVRQTAMNMCSRHRMENEGYSPPHVKRKRKIEECATTFTMHMPVAEFYIKLFV